MQKKKYIYIYTHTHAHTRTSLLKGKRCKRYSTRRQLYIGYSNTRMEKDCMNYILVILSYTIQIQDYKINYYTRISALEKVVAKKMQI